jgi:spore coat protein U-like protein
MRLKRGLNRGLNRRFLLAWRAAGCCALLLFCGAAQALCTQPLCSCSVSTSSLAFGSYNPLAGSNVDSTATVRVSCGGVAGLLVPYQIALSTGAGSFTSRRMVAGSASLAYNLYSDVGHSSVWGDGSGGSVVVNGSFLLDALGTAPAQTQTVYGRIPSGQRSAQPGSYSDTITITLTYN